MVVASYCGATSTTSPPTKSIPFRPRRSSSTSRGVRPPTSGVPVPGAKAGIEAVDVEGEIGRTVADDGARLLDQGLDPDPGTSSAWITVMPLS